MKVTNALGNAIIFSAVIGIAAGCSDRGGTGSPTEVDAVATSVGMSSSHDGNEGSGSTFKLFGDARLTRDPENPTNVVLEVISVDRGVQPPGDEGQPPAGASRKLRNVQLWQLDHQLSFKYAFVAPHSCAGGSPRMILLIDANGDGRFKTAPDGPDFAANGHINPPAFGGCPPSVVTRSGNGPAPSTLLWRFENLTDEQARWEITGGVIPGGNPPYPGATWDGLELLISTALPNHRVLEARFLEDFNPSPPGTAYYDLITVFDLTLGTRGQVNAERADRDDDDDDDDDDD